MTLSSLICMYVCIYYVGILIYFSFTDLCTMFDLMKYGWNIRKILRQATLDYDILVCMSLTQSIIPDTIKYSAYISFWFNIQTTKNTEN